MSGANLEPTVLVLMGVSGCGKSTVAWLLASRLGWPFEEGDSLHPPSNIAKMRAGLALDDQDRAPWIERIAQWVDQRLDQGESGVITCSALKRAYRETLRRRGRGVVFVHLTGPRDLIASRLARRGGHFMPASLLDSQFAALEEPDIDEPVLRVGIGPAAERVATQILETLRLQP